MRIITAALLCLVTFNFCAASDYPVQPVPFTSVRLTSGLLANRQATNAVVTMPFALDQCESSGRIKNFDLAADNTWKPVTNPSEYTIKKRDPVRVTFDSITTKQLRLEMELTKDFSAGIYEWELE